jgi:isoleucyl-tRNA synthetase
MSVSDEILKRMSEAYRRIRNTVRYLLGSLHGFDVARDAVPMGQLVDLDAWAIRRAAQLQQEIITAYGDYQFHVVYQAVHNFCVNDLGGLYLDVLKDRLYTTPAGSHPRRSAQTAIFHIAQAMVRWLAPVLSFTAEEIWRHLPKAPGSPASVFLTTWYTLPEVPAGDIEWERLFALRAAVLKELERLRDAGTIGAPLEAQLDVYARPEVARAYSVIGDELRFLTITSAARVHAVDAPPAGAVAAEAGGVAIPGVWLEARRSDGTKCVRCWHLRPDIGSDAAHPELCGRCAGNIGGRPEVRRHV